MQKNNIKKENNRLRPKKIAYYIPLIFIILIVPLIVHCKIIELPKEVADFWKGGTINADFYSYYKAVTFIIGTIAALAAYGGLALNGKLPLQKEKKYYIPTIIYSLFAIISTFNSYNKYVAVSGFPDMYQGVFVLLSYVIIMFIVLNYIRSESDIKIIVYSFVLLTVFEGMLGIGQYFGFDFFQSELGKQLITPKNSDTSMLSFTFGKNTIVGTMYNTNFIGSFSALVLPLTTILYIVDRDKKYFTIFGVAAFIAFATWLGCNSRAGYLAVASVFLIGIIIFRKNIRLYYKKLLVLFIGFVLIAILLNSISKGRVSNQFSRLNPVIEAEKIQTANENQNVKFEEILIENNVFTVKTNKETLICTIENNNLSFKDEEGKKIELTFDSEGNIIFIDDKYSEYKFNINEKASYIKVKVYGRSLRLYAMGDDRLKTVSMNNKLTDPIEAPRVKWFDGKETLASNRGYIWSRTIPMLKETLIIGYGPDNYPMVFPQEDYVGRFNVGTDGVIDIVIDKPHNMYLQTAINTGVISLLALITIWGIYLIDSFKLYIKGNMESFTEYMGAAVFLSITAYLAAGIFNDSVVSVAPLFWILLGTGIGINRIIKNE